jgi:molecular chaperone GrpE
MKPERTGENIQQESPVQPEEPKEEILTEEDHEKEELPPDKMTKAQLIEKIKLVKESSEKNFDLYVRSQADIENMKKRFQKEKEDLAKFSNETLIKQLLTVADNLEKAISHSREDNSIQSLREGVELTLKGLLDTLEKAGVERVQAVGEPFDPNFHEAVSAMENNAVESGTVLQELQGGYLLNNRLIRPAMVIVAKNGS